MECRNCGRDLNARQRVCPNCGEQVVAGLQVATKEPLSAQIFAGLRELPETEAVQTEGGLNVGEPEATSAQVLPDGNAMGIQAAATAAAPAPSAARRWSPRKDRVESWAVRRELNHYEVLDLNETATDEQVTERINLLDDTLERWAVDQMDAKTQIIGTHGKNRIYELKAAFVRRTDYNAEVISERHEQALARVQADLLRFVEKDLALQWNEWQTLEMRAREEGVGAEELEDLLREQRARGVLTGLAIGEREVRTLLALKDRCRGRGEQLVEPIWSGEMERWLERAAQKVELAAEVSQIREQYAEHQVSGATLLLWRIGEKRLVLTGNNGTEEVTSVRQFIEGVQIRGLEESALAALKDHRLENWLREAMNQEVMADVAARGHSEGRKGLLDVIRQAEAQRGESFEFENGQAYSVAELVELCDKYIDEAQGYLFDGILGSWLSNKGHGPLARQANTVVQEYGKKKRLGLEMFVRELCKKSGFEPYPHLIALPEQLMLGMLPVGARISQSIRLKNQGRGHVWGTITVEPALPGLTITTTFDSANAAIDVTLDALEVQSGEYHANVIIRAEGVPTTCQVPLQYQIVPLTVTFEPAAIELGKILHGKTESTTLSVTCAPANGRLVGVPSIDPEFKGLQVKGRVDGTEGEFQVELDTTPHEPGRQYETNIYLDTNVGRFNIPVSFGTALRWDIVAGWTGGISAATGCLLWLCRLLLANADPAFGNWFLSYQHPSTNVLVTSGVLGGIVAGTISLFIVYIVKMKKAT